MRDSTFFVFMVVSSANCEILTTWSSGRATPLQLGSWRITACSSTARIKEDNLDDLLWYIEIVGQKSTTTNTKNLLRFVLHYKKIDIHLLTFGPKLKTFTALAIKSHSRLSKVLSKSIKRRSPEVFLAFRYSIISLKSLISSGLYTFL